MENRADLQWVSGSDTPRKTLITRVINFGTWEEWRELQNNFPREGDRSSRARAFARSLDEAWESFCRSDLWLLPAPRCSHLL